jgi:hypothetical protein
MDLETTTAFRDLIGEFKNLEERILAADLDEQSRLEGYKWMFSIVSVGLEVYLWADPAKPRFVDIVGPSRKWGGDNADAYYQFAPIDPARTYRVRGRRGDAVYFSVTVYGGPDDGRYSDRIVGTVNDSMLDFGPDGSFEFTLSPDEQPGGWLKLDPDAVCAITRDYLVDPVNGRRVEWSIEALDDAPPYRERDEALARGLRAARTWVVEQAKIVPLPLEDNNDVDEPYPVPQVTYGWAAADAAYASGTFSLKEDEALVIEGTSPECRFWNVCLWNPFLHTYNYAYEQVTLNGGQIQYEPDGSWRIVIAGRDPGMPNWLSTAGHPRGRIWFRWFHPEETPKRPSTEVIRIGDR